MNLFLNGPFAPQRQEQELRALTVDGEIPADLAGTLYRMSTVPYYDPPSPEKYHWFDGDGMVFALTIEDGTASIRNRWVDTAGLRAEKEVGHALYGSFMNGGHCPPPAAGRPPLKNPANTHVLQFNNDLLVFCEADIPHRLDPETLGTLGQFDFGSVRGPVTAHFKIDPANGNMAFFGSMGTHVNYYEANNKGQLIATHPFKMEHSCFLHDFAISQNYAIFFATAAISDFSLTFKGEPNTIWDPSVPTRIGVMHRQSGAMRWFSLDDTFTTTHFLNAYEEDGKIVVDANRAPDFGARIGEANPFSVATPWRWTLDLVSGTAKGEQMDDTNCEFPRLDERLIGRKHRYGYYAATRTGEYCDRWLFDHVVRHDNFTGERIFQNVGGELTSPGETLFVPRDGGDGEDDGYAITPWWNAVTDESELVVVHSQDFGGRPLARIKLGQRVPTGFHGSWAPRAE